MKVILKILLAAAVVLLAYMCDMGGMWPVEFQKEGGGREKASIGRVIARREAQVE